MILKSCAILLLIAFHTSNSLSTGNNFERPWRQGNSRAENRRKSLQKSKPRETLANKNSPQGSSLVLHHQEYEDEEEMKELLKSVSEFTCRGRKVGFYSDVASDCKIFHQCSESRSNLRRTSSTSLSKTSLMCPPGKRFDPTTKECQWWDSVECKESFIPILKSENSRQPRLFLEHTDPYPTYNRRIRPDFDPVGGFNMYNNVREYHSPKIYYLPRAQELRCYTCCKPKDSNENFNYYDYTTQRPRPPVTRPPPPRPVTRPPRPATRPPTQDYTWVVTFSTARPTTRPTTWTTTRRPATWKPTKPWNKPTNDYTWVITTRRTTTPNYISAGDVDIIDARDGTEKRPYFSKVRIPLLNFKRDDGICKKRPCRKGNKILK